MAIHKILEHAQYGDRVVHNGKTIWGGLGNRAGLHGFADTLNNEKYDKSGPRLEKKLAGLTGEVEIHQYRNKTRDQGSWKKVATYNLGKSGKKSGQDDAVTGKSKKQPKWLEAASKAPPSAPKGFGAALLSGASFIGSGDPMLKQTMTEEQLRHVRKYGLNPVRGKKSGQDDAVLGITSGLAGGHAGRGI